MSLSIASWKSFAQIDQHLARRPHCHGEPNRNAAFFRFSANAGHFHPADEAKRALFGFDLYPIDVEATDNQRLCKRRIIGRTRSHHEFPFVCSRLASTQEGGAK